MSVKLSLTVSNRTHARMKLAKSLINILRPERHDITWNDVIEWMAETVPIPQLLAEACAEAAQLAPQETTHERTDRT